MHEMRCDLGAGIVEVDFIGFWAAGDLESYTKDLAVYAARIAAAGRRHKLLIDHSRAAIQSQEIVAALGRLALRTDQPSGPIAIFSTGRFAHLQAKRIAALREDIRVFADRASARAWLEHAGESAPPAGGGAIQTMRDVVSR